MLLDHLAHDVRLDAFLKGKSLAALSSVFRFVELSAVLLSLAQELKRISTSATAESSKSSMAPFAQ